MKTGKSRGDSAGFASTPNERDLTMNQVVLRLLPFIALWAYGCSSTAVGGPSAEPGHDPRDSGRKLRQVRG